MSFNLPLGVRAPLTAEPVVRPVFSGITYDEGDKVLPPIRSNAALRVLYRKRLNKMIDAMHNSVMWWVRAAYRANEPLVVGLAQDAPSDQLSKVVGELKKRWLKKFDEGSSKLARYFAQAVGSRTDVQLKKILKDAGISVEFKLTRAQRDVMEATIHESVSLIRSIPQDYFKNVEGAVMRSVQAGRDLESLTKNLEKNYGKTRDRAAFIARDQNNKATAALNRGRQIELGIDEAIWQHSSAGKQPRPSHVAAGKRKQRYVISEGWFDPDANESIWPGVLPNCRCTSRSIIPGFK